jgi:hypothetical protein
VPRIAWVEDGDAEGAFAEIVRARQAATPQSPFPAILRTMSVRPDFLQAINDASRLHFTDGALTRAQHEMIASYVAALNRCHY